MANELELLQFVKDTLSQNKNIVLKNGVDEVALTQKLASIYDFNDGTLFHRKTQQAAEHSAQYTIFHVGKSAGLLDVKNLGPFNRKQTHGLKDQQVTRAKELTEKVIETFLDREGYKFKDEKYGDNETRRHVIARLTRTDNFIAESTPDGEGVQLRQIKNGYLTTKAFPIKDVIDKLTAGMIDKTATELKRLEIDASIREKAQKLAGLVYDERTRTYSPDYAKADELFTTLKQEHLAQRIQRRLNVPDQSDLTQEFKNEFFYREGLIEGALTLQERRNLEGYVQDRLQDLQSFKFEDKSSLAEHEDRYRNYERVSIDY